MRRSLLVREAAVLAREAGVTTQATAGDTLTPPVDALAEAAFEIGLRTPAGKRSKAARISDQGTHFGLRRTQARLLADDRFVVAGQFIEHGDDGADLDFQAGAGIVGRAEFSIFGAAKRHKSAHRIADKIKIARRAEIAKAHLGAVWVEHLADRGRDNRALTLARPEGVERAQRDGRQIMRAGEGLDHLVGTGLARGIGRLPMQGMKFADRPLEGRAVNFAGRGVDQAPHGAGARRFEQIERAVHIDVDIGLRRHIGIGNADQGGEMKDHITAFGKAAHLHPIAHIAELDAHISAQFIADFIEPAGSAERIIKRQSRHLGAAPHQRFRQVRANEPIGAGDEHALAVKAVVNLGHGRAHITPASNSSSGVART